MELERNNKQQQQKQNEYTISEMDDECEGTIIPETLDYYDDSEVLASLQMTSDWQETCDI